MEETTQNDIRKLLKTFGVKADQAIHTYLKSNPGVSTLMVRLVLEDLTEYENDRPAANLHLEVEGVVRRTE
jgi:hypothetical protein